MVCVRDIPALAQHKGQFGLQLPIDGFLACHRSFLVQSAEYLEAGECLSNLYDVLAVGDLEGTAYVKMCENLPYNSLDGEELEYVISHIAPMADRMEKALEPDTDLA